MRTSTLILAFFHALLMYAGMSNSIEYGQLYIVGDATDTSWDLNSAAEMPRIADGVFEWTGMLAGGKEFKFMNTREAWHKHIVSVKNDVVATPGKEYPLNFFSDWALDGNLDCKFKVAESGMYTVTVDLTGMRMALSTPIKTPEWPKKFYLIGSATGNQAIEVPDFYNTEHKNTVYLRPGHLKLADTPTITSQTNFYAPRFPEVDITFGQNCDVYLCSADSETNGWSVTIAGEYQIYLDNNRHTVSCKKYMPYSVLYLVGGCCERAWNYWDDSNNRFRPKPNNPDVMVWEGELRIGWDKKSDNGSVTEPDEPDKFKILTAPDWFRDTFHPYREDMTAEGCSDARISGGDDFKWTINKDGYYRLELNTKTETLKTTYIPYTETQETNDSNLTSELTDVGISEKPNNTTYYNLQGIQLREPSSGLYIVIDGNRAKKHLINNASMR